MSKEKSNVDLWSEASSNSRSQAFVALKKAVESNNGSEIAGIIVESRNKDILSTKDSDGNTLLHIAVSKGLSSSVEVLIDFGADVSIRNIKNQTPIEMAATEDMQKVLEKAQEKKQKQKSKQKERLKDWLKQDVSISDLSAIARVNLLSEKELVDSFEELTSADKKDVLIHKMNKKTPIIQLQLYSNNKDCLNLMFKDLSAEDKKELLMQKEGDFGSDFISLAVRLNNVEAIETALDGVSVKDQKELLMQKDSRGETPLHIAAYEGNFKAIDKMLKKLDIKDKKALLSQWYRPKNQSPIQIISRTEEGVSWIKNLKDKELLSLGKDAIGQEIRRERLANALGEAPQRDRSTRLKDKAELSGSIESIKEASKQNLKDREAEEKAVIARYNTHTEKVKSEFTAEEERIRRGVDEGGDLRFNITIEDRVDNVLGRKSSSVKQSQMKGDKRREEEFKNAKEKIKRDKKDHKETLKKEQAELGKQIRKDRLARIFGGEVSGETRAELREQQKMLGRVIRSDQMTGAVDKIVESASNLKKKLSFKKGKGRG